MKTIWKMPEGENAWGRHNTGAWCTTYHLLLSPALPISPPVLDRIAVESAEHQMKWLACIQEPCCNKKMYLLFKHWNHILWGEMLPGKHVVLTEVTVPYVCLYHPWLLFLHLLREKVIPPHPHLHQKHSVIQIRPVMCFMCYRKLYKVQVSGKNLQNQFVTSTLSFMQPTFTIMQHHVWWDPRARSVLLPKAEPQLPKGKSSTATGGSFQ